MRGIYVLFLRVPYTLSTLIGGLGEVEFRAGNYAYVGSALGGVEKRVGRHLSAEKKLHWHIDYLLLRAAPYDILAAEGEKGKECEVARKLSSELSCVEGFGCSDCGCVSHLFYSPTAAHLLEAVLRAFKEVGLKPRRLEWGGG